MCTVSVIAISGGFRLVTNRDEKRTRLAAEFPYRWGPRRTGVGPFDPAGGGTWVASRPGLTLCLLNMRTESPLPPPDPKVAISRGRIIPGLMEYETVGEVFESLWGLELTRYLPFRLVAVSRESESIGVRVARWDGAELRHDETGTGMVPGVWASSGLGDAVVQRRVPQFAAMLDQLGPSVEMQDAFHRFRWPEEDHTSVLMSRPDARTVSVTEIEDRPDGVEMVYRAVRDGGAIEPGVVARVPLRMVGKRV